MSNPPTKSRFLTSIITLLVLCLVIYGLSSVLSYFHSSTGTVNQYDLGLSQLAHHQPTVYWEPDDTDIKGEINPYIREEIESAYVDAWGILNLSLEHQADLGLKENWSDIKTEQLASSLKSENKIIRSDLSHKLKLHFISYDKQVVSFSDLQVEVETSIENNGQQVSYKETSAYKVLMTLYDGKWRVNKMVRVE